MLPKRALSALPRQRGADAGDRLLDRCPGRHLQPQLAGDLVDPGRVQRQAAGVDRVDQRLGLLALP